MKENNDPFMSEEELSDDNIIILSDEEGNDIRFEFLDLINYEGNDYIFLLPEDDDSGELVILLIEESDDDGDNYASVDDQALLDTLYEIFKEKNKDFFEFEDWGF